MQKITKTIIDRIESNPPPKGYKLYFDEVRGFGVRVTAEARLTYIVQGRVRGKELRFTIGTGGSRGFMTVEQARSEAKILLGKMAAGIDPREAKRAEKAQSLTLRQLADEYLDRPGKLKESSKEQIERHMTTTFKDRLHRPITEITETYCRQRYKDMRKGGLHGKKAAPGQANQGLSVMKALLNYSIRRHKIITVNPCDALKDDWVKLGERTSYIIPSRIGAVWNWLTTQREAAITQESTGAYDLARFYLLTGARLDEALSLRWENVRIEDDINECFWHLPDPKNRHPFWHPMSTQLRDLLKARLAERHRQNPWVFPSSRSVSGHIEDPRDLWPALSKIAGEKITAHDLRRSFTTYGITECKIDLTKIELLTSHRPTGVVLRHYAKPMTQRLLWLQPEVQAISDWISTRAAVAHAQATGANVVPLRAG